MKRMEVVVEGNCYVSGRLERCCVGIENGRISKIAKTLDGDKVYNFGSKLVIPGAIDAHVHFRDPGMTNKEDFGTGSMAAICGGVTCVFDMPNTRPPTTTLSALRDKKRIAECKSLVDFGLFAGVRPGTDIASLSKEAVGFKLYMASTTGGLLVTSLDQVRAELQAVAASGKVLAVHAEDESLRAREAEESLEDHMRNRSADCEASAIRKLGEKAKACRLHICHVSAKNSLPLLAKIPNLTAEVTPHHLLLDTASRLGTLGKVNPPLRRRDDRQGLFQGLKDGKLDIVASDHAPHTLEEKEESFDYAPTGMPGVETMLPLMLHHVKERHLDLGTVVRGLCERPGEIYGVNKGRIAPGYDADLSVIDISAASVIKGSKLHSKCAWSAFEGMHGVFPKAVLLRGEVIVEDGYLVGERKGRDSVGRQE
ncbi:MAG: dihydroorotase [Candidatus Thermoplasmatota archaeon]|nr:dihydroorotase [Candidatus Thermoplasmatota archaeon]